MKTNKAIALSVAVLALGASAAYGQGSTTNANTSTSSTASTLDTISKNIRADFLAFMYGPSTNDPFGTTQAEMGGSEAATGKDQSALLRTRFRAGYQVTNEIKARAAFEFDTFAISQKASAGAVDPKGSLMRDPFLQISHSNLYHSGNFQLAGDVRAYAPGKATSRENGMIVAPRVTLDPRYDFPGSRFSLAGEAYLKDYVWNDELQRRQIEGYVGPQVEYQLTPTLKATVLYELQGFTAYNGAPSGNDYTDLEPGVSWDISRSVNLSPYLNLYPGGQLSLRTTYVGATLSVNLL